jgi:tetratricopeptide (TPR) repeat protein
MLFPARLSLAALLFAPAAIILTHEAAFAQSATQVANTAKQVTVLIQGQNPGSGVIIRREGNTYTVLTARHVVATPDEYEIVTPDGQKHRLNYSTVKPLPGVDLATLQFTSTNAYPVAKLGNSRTAPSGTPAYVAGFPITTAAINQSIFSFTEGKIVANADRPLADGYALVYSNNTLPGMSGGPVMNGAGEVIGIHGKGDVDSTSAKATANPNVALKTGFNLAIPINTFLSLASQTGVTGFTAPAAVAVSTQPKADDLYLQAVNKLRNFDNKGAIADFDQVIRLNPNNAMAYRDRALARLRLADEAGACADLDRSLQLNSQDGLTYSRRATCRSFLGNRQGAQQDINQAVQLSPNDARVLVNRGNFRHQQKDYKGAISDHTEAIRLDPQLANAYNGRGFARAALGDRQGALTDYNEAIRLTPKDVAAYISRGVARSDWGDKQGAIQDYTEAIRLEPQYAGSYNNRGLARYHLGDMKGAFSDFTEAIRLNPQHANAYLSRGTVRAYSGDRQGAISDYQKAADLARAQGNQQVYEKATQGLRRLQP